MLRTLTYLFFCFFIVASADAAAPTFDHDIAPIVYDNCVSCHRSGEGRAIFAGTYTDVKKRAEQIVDVTHDRYMPPWKPEPGYGNFVGSRRLSDEQIKLIADWSAAGCPEGDAKDLPAKPTFSEGWLNGPPDLIVKMPKSFMMPGDGDGGPGCVSRVCHSAEPRFRQVCDGCRVSSG